MRPTLRPIKACLAVALLWACAESVRGEVSAEPGSNQVNVLVLGIIEGPDPIPQVLWKPVRNVPPVRFLNPSGAVRGDGRPDIAMDPVTRWPHVVWSYNTGSDHDIAYSRWTGSEWLPTEFLTASTVNEVDPRIFVDESKFYVVWWEPATKTGRMIKRPRAGSWEAVEQIGTQVLRPSVATWNGTVLVASEQDEGVGGKVMLSTRLSTNNYTTQCIGSAPQEGALNVVLHAEQGKLWLDWRHSDAQFAYSRSVAGVWTPTATLPWTDTSWVKLEEVRLAIRNIVLASP